VQSEPLPITAFEHLPVFVLPDVVLFPGTVLPLRVFETGYCNMVADALKGDRALAVVLRKTGLDACGQPALHDIAGAGRIIHADELPEGRYNILVHGLCRVRLTEEIQCNRGYRRFKATVVPPPDEHDLERAKQELAKLQSCVLSLRSSVAETDAQLVEVLRSTSDPLELADILAATLVSEPERQQYYLSAVDLRERLGNLIDALAEVMVRIGAPPKTAMMN
jgi:Lon protease-like protein